MKALFFLNKYSPILDCTFIVLGASVTAFIEDGV